MQRTVLPSRILVTCPPMIRSIGRYRELFDEAGLAVHCPQMTQTLSEEELIQELPNYDGWIIGDDPATARVFIAGAAGRLRAAVKWGVGVDNVDFEGARAVGLPISNTPGMFGEEVADLALGYVIALAREMFVVSTGVHEGGWPKPVGLSLRDKVAAVIGFGNIGQATAERLLACKMRVQVYDPLYRGGAPLESAVKLKVWPLGLGDADFIVLCCNLTKENRHMIDAKTLSSCKRGVRIVNVSRGPLIDERALAGALEDRTVHSAALEVFETEPLPASSPLRGFKNCIFGSHNGSNTQEAVDRTSRRAIELLRLALASK